MSMDMKRLQILGILGLFVLASCQTDEITCSRVTGEVETQRRTLGSFNQVFFNGVGNLHISQGNEQDFIVKGQTSVLEALVVNVNNGELFISLSECFTGDDYQLDVFVTLPEIKKIQMSGTGKFYTDGQITADYIEIILGGVTEAFEVDVVADSISTRLTGSGNMTFKGSALKHKILLSGVGDIHAYEMPVGSADVVLNGVGNVHVKVEDALKATITSNGNIFYKGSPEISESLQGTGKVVDAN